MAHTYRVSHLAAYARWKAEESDDLGWLAKSIFSTESSEAMERGTAFHKALETAAAGEYTTVSANGYTFAFTCEAEIVLPKTREIRKGKDYGGIIVSGQCDGIEGKRIIDHKTTGQQFDAEYHLDGWQHRFYLDIFEADRFDWHVWEMSEMKDAEVMAMQALADSDPLTTLENSTYFYEVYAHHLLTQYRYPAIEEDCRLLAVEFRDFASRMGWQGRAA